MNKRWRNRNSQIPFTGKSIREYCIKHLKGDDSIYRIFFYDTAPLNKRGHNPLSGKAINFAATDTAQAQIELLDSLRRTPQVALRLGSTVWHNSAWIIDPRKTKGICDGKISSSDLTDKDVWPQIQQKAVDMKLGIDITYIALKRLADFMVIVSGDADLVPALKLARTEGVQICLDPMRSSVSPDLAEHVDFVTTFAPKKKSGKLTAC